jgi:integrase
MPEGATKDEAEDKWEEIRKTIKKESYTPEKKIPQFSKVALDWLEYKKPKLRANTWEVCEGHLRNHFKELDGLKINTMTTARLERFITKRQNEGMNINTLRKILVTLGQILSYAVRHKYLDQNPLREVERPRNPGEEKKELTILTPEQLRAFLEAEEDQKYKTLFLVAVMTGARQGELLGLKWGDLDLINSQIHIQRTFTKGQFFPTKTRDSKRKIDLSPAVMLELKKWKLACPKNDLDLIFPNEAGEPMNYSNMVQRHFLPALEKAGIIEIEKIKNKPKDPKKYKKAFRKTKGMKVRFHDLRHGFASLLIEQGENIKYIQAMLGHSSPMVTLNVYAHLMKPTNQEAVLKLENAILGCDGSKNGSRAGLETKKELTS